jgi:hypothetical protein
VSGIHRLPMLEVGFGERRDDCDHYSGCLGRWLKLNWRGFDREAHCPRGCASFAEQSAEERHEQARMASAGKHGEVAW